MTNHHPNTKTQAKRGRLEAVFALALAGCAPSAGAPGGVQAPADGGATPTATSDVGGGSGALGAPLDASATPSSADATSAGDGSSDAAGSETNSDAPGDAASSDASSGSSDAIPGVDDASADVDDAPADALEASAEGAPQCQGSILGGSCIVQICEQTSSSAETCASICLARGFECTIEFEGAGCNTRSSLFGASSTCLAGTTLASCSATRAVPQYAFMQCCCVAG